MNLNPFLAVLIVFFGVSAAIVGNRLLKSASFSESHGELRLGYWLFSGGLIVAMSVFLFDPTSIFQAGPDFANVVRDFFSA
jgi:hypothetical protein